MNADMNTVFNDETKLIVVTSYLKVLKNCHTNLSLF